jgi:hypothetical protein
VYQVQVSRNLIEWLDLGEARTAAGAEDGIGVATKEAGLWFRILKLR